MIGALARTDRQLVAILYPAIPYIPTYMFLNYLEKRQRVGYVSPYFF